LESRRSNHTEARKHVATRSLRKHETLGFQDPGPVKSLTDEFLKLRVSTLKAKLTAVGKVNVTEIDYQ
jgi:hypothetical protein